MFAQPSIWLWRYGAFLLAWYSLSVLSVIPHTHSLTFLAPSFPSTLLFVPMMLDWAMNARKRTHARAREGHEGSGGDHVFR